MVSWEYNDKANTGYVLRELSTSQGSAKRNMIEKEIQILNTMGCMMPTQCPGWHWPLAIGSACRWDPLLQILVYDSLWTSNLPGSTLYLTQSISTLVISSQPTQHQKKKCSMQLGGMKDAEKKSEETLGYVNSRLMVMSSIKEKSSGLKDKCLEHRKPLEWET